MAGPNDPPRLVHRGRHVTVHFKLDWNGIAQCAMGKDLRRSVRDLVRDKAMPYAISISPRSDATHTHYQDSFTVVMSTVTIRGLTRVAAQLYNIAPHAAAVEWGNRRIRHPHRVLGQTLDHLHNTGPNQHN